MNPRIRFVAAAASLAATAALAQPALPDAPPTPRMTSEMLGGPMRHDLLFAAGPLLEQEKVVQGAPYCADAVHETIQQLADGNRIVQKQGSRQCRDAQGRTRQEVTLPSGRVTVFLRDPIAKEAWMLDADRKLAVRIDLPRHPLASAEPQVLERMRERMQQWSRHLSEEIREHLRDTLRMSNSADPHPATGTPALDASAPPAPVRVAMHGMPGIAGGMLPAFALHPRLLGPRGPGATTMLPGDTIEGLRADGKRTVWTIDAGRIGNEKPITIVNEVWSSPDLGITLRTRDVDPLAGEDTFSVRNVVRGEPDAQLFRVPADYAKVSPPELAPNRK
jgi:hypothetical protein